MDIANRLANAIPQNWTIASGFHRTTNDGYDLYFHQVETHNDRVTVPSLMQFGEQFQDIDDHLKIERVRDESPGVFDEAVDFLGREEALEMFTDMGGSGARLVNISAKQVGVRVEDVRAEILLRVELDYPISEDDFQRFIATEFMGKVIRAERAGNRQYLLGGSLTHNIAAVRETLDVIEATFDTDREGSAIVCRAIEDTRPA